MTQTSSRSFAATQSGRDSPDTPFEEDGVSSEHGGSSEEDRASTTDFGAAFSVARRRLNAATTAERAPFEYTSARRKEIADAMVRYFFYVEHGVPSHSAGESAEAHLAPPKQEWFERTLALVPPEPKGSMTRARFETLILRFLEEMREDQARAARKAVVDYALTDAHERRRLGVEALAAFLPAPPGSALAAERHRRARHAETREGGGARASSRRKERASPVEIGAAASSHFAPSPYVSLPLGWSASVDDARFALERRLRVNTWHALELARDWHAHHAEEPLCDVTSEAFTLGLPYEADAFDAFQKAAFERAKNGIWDSWRAKSMAAFKTRPPAPANASRLGGGDVYEAVAAQQASELRALVRRRVAEYAAFFETRAFSDEHLYADPLAEKLLWDRAPVFVVRVVPHVTETETRVEVEAEDEEGEEGEEEGEGRSRPADPAADPEEGADPAAATTDDAASIATEPDSPEASAGGGGKRRFVTRTIKSAEARFDPPLDAVARVAVGALDRVLAAAGVRGAAPCAAQEGGARDDRLRDRRREE